MGNRVTPVITGIEQRKRLANPKYRFLMNYFYDTERVLDKQACLIDKELEIFNELQAVKKLSAIDHTNIITAITNIMNLVIEEISMCPYVKIEIKGD